MDAKETESRMNSRPVLVVVSVIVALILLTGVCSAGFIAGKVYDTTGFLDNETPAPQVTVVTENMEINTQGSSPEELEQLFEPFWQTWNLVEDQFVEQPVDQEAMMRGAIRGMLDTLDDAHTSYLDPDMFERANAELEGEEYEGIGAWVDITGDFLTIISPMPGSPAEEAGLLPGDKVTAVDGDDMTGIDGELVRQRIVGPKNTVVRLTIQRAGVEPLEVSVERDVIVVPSVTSKMLEGDIGYVQLFNFGSDTSDELHDQLKDLMRQNPNGMILDLRFNGGGYLHTAIEVASEFIGEGVVMYEEYGNGTRKTYEASRGGLATEIPMVVLINEGSASASEIVAGAIQDLERGELVGVTSFGKGSVQNYQKLVNDQGAVRVTIARWLTPDERQINGIGLEPDYVVEQTAEAVSQGLDPQLDKAIELLTNQAYQINSTVVN